jgi:hypothetical protein
VTGIYSSLSISLGTDTLTNPGMFLVKYDATGNVIWAKEATGSNHNYGNCVATDNAGNIYVAGYFSSNTISFDTIQLIRHDTTVIWSNLFLVKYDSSGNVIWAKNTAHGSSTANAVATDNLGNIFITGGVGNDSLVIGTDTLYPSSYYDSFVAKYDAAGNGLWVRGISAGGGAQDVLPPFIATDKYGNVYVTGPFPNPVAVIVSTVFVNQGAGDMYLAKFSSTGNLLWAKSYGASGQDDATSIATDTSGNVYITGFFASTNLTFDTITVHGYGATGFVAKLNSGGTAIWVKQIDNLYAPAPLKVKTNLNADVFVTGYFIPWNSSSLMFTPMDSLVHPGLFLAKYDSNGNYKWARDAIGGGRATSITVDNAGNPFIAGYFGSDSLIFDSTVLLNDTTTSINIFIAAINSLVSIEENNAPYETSLSIFPIPSNGKFYVVTKQHQKRIIIIYDGVGKEIFNTVTDNQIEPIDISAHPPGIYLVKVIEGDKTYSKKIIIQ